MKCPYCTSEISDAALACPHCAHDLYLLKPLLERIAALEAQLKERDGAAAPAGAVAETDVGVAGEAPAQAEQSGAARPGDWILLWGTPLALLLAAHGLITVVYDLNNLYLRLVSLFIPLPFGFLLMLRGRHAFGASLFAAFCMELLAVLGMSGLTALVDQTPLLPQNMREWREFVEYAASVGLSYVTGMVLGEMLRHRIESTRDQAVRSLALKLARMITSGQKNAEKVEAMAKKLNDLGGSLTAAATTAASVYMGMQGVIGGKG